MRPPLPSRCITLLAALALFGACSQDATNPNSPFLPPGPPSLTRSTVTVSPSSITADGVSAATITVRLIDAQSRPLVESGGSVTMYATAGTVGAVADHGDGTYTAALTAPTQAGRAAISARLDGSALTRTYSIDYTAGPPSPTASFLYVADSALLADGVSTTTVTVYLRDTFGNLVTSPSHSVVIATTMGSVGTATRGYGDYSATLTSASVEGTASVTAEVDGMALTASASVRFGLHHLWARKASPALCCRYNIATATVGGILYEIAGFDETYYYYGDVSASVDAYDPAADHWAPRAPIPTARFEHAVGVVNGIIYAVGGSTDNGITNVVEAYDPATDTWSTKAPMPTARSSLAVGVVGGTLYAMGGESASGRPLDVVEAYDPATNSWTTKAPMPAPRAALGAGVVNGIIYAVGGYPDPTSTLIAYDPATNSWSSKAFMPTGRTTVAAGAFGNDLYALGGDGRTAFELYDPAANSWSTALPMPVPGNGFSAIVVNGSLYAVRAGDGTAVYVYVP